MRVTDKYRHVLIERTPCPHLTLLCVACLILIAIACWIAGGQ